ncbi:DHA2 family efflux MFS transporter permease subunit [Tatumella citrea]|uniref:EmrB/QacA family drug resistance transporter n=1 Tax=Tatumella citrea TaxID=53336 RepID=A0A1Y0LLB3_TATCI|nr:DHA2 family efflux MFS transporter permease subunit [Tatumella citrea]ARU94824.1 EmrB/QacA family drug resistance transporter [Tatumella citrea]ARU98862.1 EmrB/QacA family drug resistance transporter [Tatumella citrea]
MSASDSWKPASNPWLVALTVTLAVFMEVLDSTIVNVALPHVAGSLSSSYDESTWVLTSYLVANGIVLPISAFLSRYFGRKNYFLLCIVMFTLCSFLCGIATELWQLILFRILQGFFGGGLQPVQQSVLLDYFSKKDRGKAFGLSSIAIIVAPVIGPTLGGWITDNYSWRWIFFINIPVGIMTALAIYQLLEDPPWEKKSAKTMKVDYIGISLITLGLGCLQVFLDRGEDEDWFNSNFIILFATLAVIGIVGAIYWLMYAKKPVVDILVMRDRNFWVAGLLMAAMAFILYGSSVVIPQLAQQDLGYTATLAGLVLTPGAICIILTIPLVLRLMPVIQTRFIIMIGFICLTTSFFFSAQHLTPDLDFGSLVFMRSTQSIGLGFLFVPLTTIAFITIPQRLNADASALFTMFRNVAGSIGISLSTAAITERQQARSAYLSDHMSTLDQQFNQAVTQMTDAVKNFTSIAGDASSVAMGQLYKQMISQARFLAYVDVFSGLCLIGLVMIPFCLLLAPVKSEGSAGGH